MASQRDRSRKWDGGRCLSLLTMMCFMIPAATHVHNKQQLHLPFHFHPLSEDNVLAQKNKPLQLNCPVTSSSSSSGPARISWHFESEDIPANDQRRIIEQNGSLLIKKFLLHRKSKKNSNTTQENVPNRKNDEGRYFCIARNDVGAVVSRPIHVIGVRPPQVSKELPVTIVEASQGSNVRLVCQTNSSAAEFHYRWLINNNTITDSDKYNQLPNGILQIINVTNSDASLFTCSILLKSEVFLVKEWQLRPHPSPDQKSLLNHQILSPSQNLTRKTKESVVLECLPHLANEISNVTWTRSSDIPLNHSVDQFGNLHLPDLKLDDSDTYVCSLDGIVNVTHVQTLRVIAEPVILKLPQSVASPSSQTARFECLAEGHPPPLVRWFRDGSPVSLTGRFSVKGDDQTLVISQSVSSDSGVYQCLVENEAGSATAAARLLISAANDQPRPPRIILLQPISSTSVKLQLEPDESDTSVIKAYTIHYTAAGGQELQHVSPNTSVVIENLSPFTKYTFYARAYGNSASEPSASSFVETKDDVPVRSPKIELSAISPTSVRVSWSPLPPAQARGQVTKYEIHYKKRSQTAYHVTDVPDGKIDSFVLEDLQPSHRYDVRVLAGTSAGFPKVSDGPLWPWTSIEMPAIDDHIITSNFTDGEPESSSNTPSLISVTTTRVPEKTDRIGISVIHLLVWIMAGSVISAALVCLCILTLHCRKKSSPAPREDRNGNRAFVNGNLPSMYGDVAEGREMESFLQPSVAANKVTETRIEPKQVYVSLK